MYFSTNAYYNKNTMNKIGILGKGSGKGGIDQGKIDVFFSFFPFFLIFSFFFLIFSFFRCSLPTAMSISRSEILRRKKAETEDEKLPSVKVLESVS